MSKNGGTGTGAPQEVTHATLKGGTVANAANNDASHWSAVANAHAAFARFCELKSLMRRSAAVANAANNETSLWLAVAKAHAAFASLCEVK